MLGGFGVYATLRAFEGTYYEWGPYLSPFYSPLIDAGHRWWKFSPALLQNFHAVTRLIVSGILQIEPLPMNL